MITEHEPPELFARHQVLASPDYRMLSIHGGSGYRYGNNAVIRMSTREGAAADEHWLVLQCGHATVKVRLDVTVWSIRPSGRSTDDAE